MKQLIEVKATLLDDDAFRLLALPYGGPIPYPGAPRGADLDRQWFSERTDFALDPKMRVPVTWHHGADPLVGKSVVGEAGNPDEDEDGWWVDVWLRHGERRLGLIKKLAEAAQATGRAAIFGSSEAQPGKALIGTMPWRRSIPGEISYWPYSGQTLSTSPQNTKSVLVPVKATLDDLASGGLEATSKFFDDLASFMDNLAPDPASEAKAGRVLAGRNEARLREARDLLDESYFDAQRRKRAIAAISDVLAELEKAIE